MKHKSLIVSLTVLSLAAGVLAQQAAAPPASLPATAPATQEANPAYKNLALSFKARATDLVSRLTLDEKALQVQVAIGQSKEAKTLGIPPMNWWSEAIHGISRAGPATQFPQAIAMAAAWDPEMMHTIGDCISDEARVKYNPDAGEQGRYYGLTMWAPTVNMLRDPRWGRTQETYGEDPVLTSRLAVEYIRGLQGDDPKYLKTVATAKHFAMHSQETGRYNRSFDISERTLREYYLPAFHASFVEGKAASTMAALSGINAMPCTQSHWLLTDLLRTQWGFDGAVVTDWGGVQNLGEKGYGIYPDMAQAAAAAINAGVDVICNPYPLPDAVKSAVTRGFLKEKDLDQALIRNMTLRFRLGIFDPPEIVPFKAPLKGDKLAAYLNNEDHQLLALRAARESIVLLQNDPAPPGFGVDRLLPLDLKKIHSIAVVGPYANIAQFGNYSGDPVRPAITPLGGLDGSFPPTGPYAAKPSQAGVGQVGVGDRIRFNTVLNWQNITACANAAANSDVAIVVVGLTSDRRGNSQGMQPEEEGMDRPTLELPAPQLALIQAVAAANPLTIVVLEGGGVIGCESFKKNVPAILMLWYPGERGGTALADILLGKVSPSGRLPMTFYRDVADLPPLDNYEISKGRTYMYATKPPTFVFGHGLSYTTFAYANMHVDQPIPGATSATVTLDITNTGKMAGDEVVQLYAHLEKSVVSRPLKQLIAFQRVSLAPSQTVKVQLSIRLSDVAYWDTPHHQFVIEPGNYELMAGASSADIRVRDSLKIQ